MGKGQALAAGQEAIVEALLKELGGGVALVDQLMKQLCGSTGLPDLLRKAVAEGARWQAREVRRQMDLQLHEGSQGHSVVSEAPQATPAPEPHDAVLVAQPSSQGSTAPEGPQAAPAPATGKVKRKKKVAECPVPKCSEPGVRMFHNFCRKHFAKLTDKQKEDFRAKQVEARKPQPPLLVKCPVADCTNPGIRPLHNFCRYHYDKLSDAQKTDLRTKQFLAHRSAKLQKQKEKRRAEKGRAVGELPR